MTKARFRPWPAWNLRSFGVDRKHLACPKMTIRLSATLRGRRVFSFTGQVHRKYVAREKSDPAAVAPYNLLSLTKNESAGGGSSGSGTVEVPSP